MRTPGGILPAMGRRVSKLVMGPAGICNVCGHRCGTLDQAGIACYHCGLGLFVHRAFWTFHRCPECDGLYSTACDTCNGVGCLAVPKELDLDVADLYRWMAALVDRYRGADAVPALVKEAADFARVQLDGSCSLNGRQFAGPSRREHGTV
jgi:hypothetical protein